jgi:hypothetical protein
MTRWQAFEQYETKVGNSEVTPQVISPIARSLMNSLGLKYDQLPILVPSSRTRGAIPPTPIRLHGVVLN